MDRQASIHCPIGLFPGQEEEIGRLTQAINQARTAAEKAPWAQALIETVDVLLACEQYDEGSMDCGLCRNFSELRRKAAALVIKAGHLDVERDA
jgi:Mor family transcriptional regulator